jgi:uncharacterized protein (DUF4213/DUF364 family)
LDTIIDETLEIIQTKIPNLYNIYVEKVVIGLRYTGVKLDCEYLGICHSLLGEQNFNCCQIEKRAGDLADSLAIDIATMSKSENIRESVIGIAAINALSQLLITKDEYIIDNGNFIDYIIDKIKKNDTVSLIGCIKPFIKILKTKTEKLFIFDKSPSFKDEDILPYTMYEKILPKTDIVIATGSSIANKTLDHVLELSEKAREIGIVGPSAGLLPEVLFRRGVKVIGNIKTINPDRLLQIIAEGGGTPQIKPIVNFINIYPKTN